MRLTSVGLAALIVCGASQACGSFGADAADSKDGGGGLACAPGKHTVCQDFDHGDPADPWSVSNLGTAALLVTDLSFSPPTSLRATAGNGGVPLVTVRLPEAKHVRCGFKIDVTQSATVGGADVLHIGSAGADYVAVTILPTTIRIGLADPGTGHELPTFQANRFTEIVLEVSTVAGAVATVTIDGIPHPLNLPFKSEFSFDRAEFGLAPVGSSAIWTANFDDAYCDVLP